MRYTLSCRDAQSLQRTSTRFLWLLRHGNYTVLYDTLHVSHGTCHALPFNNWKITAGIKFFNGQTPFHRRRLKLTWSWHVCYYTWYHIVYVVHNISPIISHTTIMIFRLLPFFMCGTLRCTHPHLWLNSTEPITAFIPNSFVEAARHVTTRHKTLLLSFGFFYRFYNRFLPNSRCICHNNNSQFIRHMRYHLVLINQNNKLCIYLCRSNFRNTVHEVCTKCQ